MIHDIFRIVGNRELSGSVQISGSKNAALPVLAAALACPGKTLLQNVPQISDVEHFLEMLAALGVLVQQEGDRVTLDSTHIALESLDFQHLHVAKMRASILLLAPLLIRFGEIRIPFPGGCVLGKRSVESHLRAFTAFGAEVVESREALHLKLPKGHFTSGNVVLPEISVTATENAILAASFAKGLSEIRLAAAEPHVQNLCELLRDAGVGVEGIGTHTLRIEGNPYMTGLQGAITPDYLEVGTFALAGILTDSEITVEHVVKDHLDAFWEKLHEVGAEFSFEGNTLLTKKRKRDFTATRIQTGVFPKFPTDLHPQFAVLMTQAVGTSHIFETLFERKFAYLLELEKMGASVEIRNPHQFCIAGKTELVGAPVASQDIRAGAAMFLAALTAKGETEISNIRYLDRGYERLEEKLRGLGAEIERIEK